MDYFVLPPEINSARIFSGAGPGSLHVAARAWEGLASELASSADSFRSVVNGLLSGPWSGPTSVSMAAAATPYVGWLSTAAIQAELAAAQVRAAATAFEAALTATVHPAAVSANRVSLMSLIATNFLGQNTPAIAATEFNYVEMWAQDIGAMVGYHTGASAVAESLTPFSLPPVVTDLASQVAVAATSISTTLEPVGDGATTLASGLVGPAQALASALPVESLASMAQMMMTPASMMIGPLLQMAQSTTGSTSALAAATAADLADAPKFAGDIAPLTKALGGSGLGGAASASLGQSRMLGPMSVPPTWPGSAPKEIASALLSGVGSHAAELTQVPQPAGSGGMPMMPMPMGAGAAGAGMPGGMLGRGGAGAHVVQQRPSVIPRAGVG